MVSRGILKYASTLLMRVGNNIIQPISRRITTTSKNLTLLDFEKQTVPKRRSLAQAFLNLEQLDPNLYRLAHIRHASFISVLRMPNYEYRRRFHLWFYRLRTAFVMSIASFVYDSKEKTNFQRFFF